MKETRGERGERERENEQNGQLLYLQYSKFVMCGLIFMFPNAEIDEKQSVRQRETKS